MFKGACRLDDPAHRTIIFVWLCLVKKNRTKNCTYIDLVLSEL